MPSPALNIDDYIEKLDQAIKLDKRLGDLDRYKIENFANSIKTRQPDVFFVVKSLLAAADGDEDQSLEYIKTAYSLSTHSVSVNYNYALLLSEFGYIEESIEILDKTIDLSMNNSLLLMDKIIALALRINNYDINKKIFILIKDNKYFDNKFKLLKLNIQNNSSDENIIATLNNLFSQEYIENNSIDLSADKRWNDMVSLADELEQYVK